jgi:hypothetical protein
MTVSRESIVIGVFEDRTAVAQALHALLEAGFQENQLGFVARQESAGLLFQQEAFKKRTSSSDAIVRGMVGGILGAIDLLLVPITGPSDASLMLETALPATEEVIDRMTHSGMYAKQLPPAPTDQTTSSERSQQQESDQAQERTSVVTGGVVGTAVAALLLPEIGPVVVGGLLATLLSGAALGGMAGGFLGTFANMGVPKRKITYYKQEMKASKTLVTIQTPDRQAEAMEILSHYAAHDIATYSHHGPSIDMDR